MCKFTRCTSSQPPRSGSFRYWIRRGSRAPADRGSTASKDLRKARGAFLSSPIIAWSLLTMALFAIVASVLKPLPAEIELTPLQRLMFYGACGVLGWTIGPRSLKSTRRWQSFWPSATVSPCMRFIIGSGTTPPGQPVPLAMPRPKNTPSSIANPLAEVPAPATSPAPTDPLAPAKAMAPGDPLVALIRSQPPSRPTADRCER